MTCRHDWLLGCSTCLEKLRIGQLNEDIFAAYKAAGITYMEISFTEHLLDEADFIGNPEKIALWAEKHGVTLWSLHLPFGGDFHAAVPTEGEGRRAIDKCRAYIEAGVRIGIKTYVLHPSYEPNAPEMREPLMQNAIANMTELSLLCHQKDAALAVEDLPRTCLGNCSADILRFLREVPYLTLCFDTNHLTAESNEVFLDALLRAGMQGKVRTVHVSDYDFIDERHKLPMDDHNDWGNILTMLEKLEYTGAFMYEIGARAYGNDREVTLADVSENYQKLLETFA